MNKLQIIVDGWKNFVFKNPEVEKIAKQRALICSSCDNCVLISGKGVGCSKCMCPFASKLRATGERCPIGKWESVKLEP
jgi:hypothetical protein